MLRERFDADGFAGIPQVLPPEECEPLVEKLTALGSDSAGTRCLLAEDWCRSLAQRLRAHPAIAQLVPEHYAAVQCTYFEKSAERNWLVPIHQDLSIPVASRVEHPALRGWSEKEGGTFVQPPADVLAQLVAVRLHLDRCDESDGPLQFVPGTHRYGRIGAEDASRYRQAGPLVACTAERGDALAMRPLVLHASSKADGGSRRRVLHVVFGPRALPFGLAWQRTV